VRDLGQVQGNVPERIHCRRNSFAHLTDHIGLKLPCEDGVNNAGAVGGVDAGLVDEVAVKKVQGSDEEFMGILLLVTCEVVRMRPNHVKELVKGERRPVSREELLEEPVELAHYALVGLVVLTDVAVGQEVVSQEGGVDQNLDDTVHEAGVSQIDQSSEAYCGVFGESAPLWIVEKDLDLLCRGLPMFIPEPQP
jgi:hypothetical protein